MLRTRLITGLIAVAIVTAGVFAGGFWFWGGAMVFAVIAAWEFGQMMNAGGYHPAPVIILPVTALLVVDGYFPAYDLLPLILSLAMLGALGWQLFHQSDTPTADWAMTVAGGLYIGWGMAHVVALREAPLGFYWVWVVLLCTWASDTFAYFTGRAIGRRKLWPRHSPNKTWEGLVGGIVASVVMAALFAVFGALGWLTALLAGLIIPVAGLFGDLSISMMKRDVGVKDSSNLFPGHGGFLDRIDSLLFIAVVVYYLVRWI
jgi:phosphatidate cytidylyltransferase